MQKIIVNFPMLFNDFISEGIVNLVSLSFALLNKPKIAAITAKPEVIITPTTGELLEPTKQPTVNAKKINPVINQIAFIR